ncbi:hypothetical protein FRB91_010026 [Serendipita sp. 411]|nr:hypothetical protein FRB91_010026 [Serendipita sp. 411]
MSDSLNLPTELWCDVLSFALLNGLLPSKQASLFEDLDLFGHPCKIHHHAHSIRKNIRLVCRLWNDIVQQLDHPVVFVEGNGAENPLPEKVYSKPRAELLYEIRKYCLKWPCALTCRKGGRCPQGSYQPPIPHMEAIWLTDETRDSDIRVLRLLDGVRDSTFLLESCPQLEALWIRYPSFRALYTSHTIYMDRISHLHLDIIVSHGNRQVYSLDLPHLVHLELTLYLYSTFRLEFPLDIYMPNLKTLWLDGYFDYQFATMIEDFILTAKESIVNLLISCNTAGYRFMLPLERLAEFPHLATVGIHVDSLMKPPEDDFSNSLLPTLSSPLSLVLLHLDAHHRQPSEPRKLWASDLVEILSTARGWFSKLVVPLSWKELEELWVQSCEIFDVEDLPFREDDPLPCLWSVLDHIYRHQPIPIVDRYHVPLGEGDGVALVGKMRRYVENNEYKERRRRYTISKSDEGTAG